MIQRNARTSYEIFREPRIRSAASVPRLLFSASLFALFLLAFLVLPTQAIPVEKPFGDFPKAIVFTGPAAPKQTVPIIVADGDTSATDTKPGLILTPLGDGSWAVLATVYPGNSYNYYFEFRIPEFELDSTQYFLTTEPGGTRNQDANWTRTITIPASATDGYVIYNAYGDRTVWGAQGNDTTLASSNTYLSRWLAQTLLSSTDADTSGRDETNNYNVTATQLSASRAKITWEYSLGGDGFAPQVEGAARFLTTSPPAYGFQILRAESDPTLPPDALTFTDITPLVSGLAFFSDDDNDPWNSPTIFLDTSITAQPDSVFVYTVKFKNAYGMGSSDTSQFFAGGYQFLIWKKMAVQVDGTIDSMYGPFIAEDPAADQSNYTNLDLTHLWVTRDADNFYFGIEINADIFNTAWGYYNILIDTTGDSTQGAPDFKSGSLGTLAKKIGFPNNKPEYAVIIQSTNRSDPANKAEIWKWNGSDWQWAAALDNFAVSTNNSRSYIELAVPAADIGSPTRIWTEVFSSGNGTNDPALDTLNKLDGDTENNEWNAPDFNVGTTGALAVSTPFPPALLPPRSATALAFDSTGFIFFEYPAQNPALVDHYNIYLGADSNAVSAADPSTLAGTTPWNATVFETTTVPAGDYFAIVEAVGLTGETALSNLALLSVNASGDSIIAVQQNEVGRTIIELSLSQWKAVHAGDTFFLIRILDYNSLYEIAHFNDTALAEKLAMINKANAAVFFDPNLRLVSDFIYSDTLAPLRYVDVVLPDGSPAPDSYLSGIDVRFEIPYLTTSDGVTLEGPSLGKEKTLLIRKLDEGQLKWAEPNAQKTQWVEEPNDRVVVITSEFSIWNVLVGAGVINNLDNLVVYPNPFNEADYYAKGHPAPAHVTFAFIPNSTERIEIFNVAGERVRTLDPNDPNEFESNGTHLIAKWDARNDFGRKVASGIYIFWIRANGQVKIGKIAVIK